MDNDYTLSEQKLFYLDGRNFETLNELAGHMRRQLHSSPETFQKLCHKLVDYDGKPDAQFEAWLISLGKKGELENWRGSMR